MELFQVRYFLALAGTLNFTRAAEACNVSQPALTRAIQRLEEELGGPLLHRERNLTQLTALGRAMLPHLQAAHAAAETAAAQAAAFRRRESEPLRLGIEVSLSTHVLAPVLGELQPRIGGFELGLVEAASPDLLERLMAGELDSAVLVDPEKSPERLERWRLFHERYVVLCPEGHRLAKLAAIPLGVLAKESLILRGAPDCDLDQALLRLSAAAGIEPSVGSVGDSYDNALAETINGLYKAEVIHRRGAVVLVRGGPVRHPRMGGLVQQPPHPRAHRRHAAGRSRGTLLRYAGAARHGSMTQTKLPPKNPAWFILKAREFCAPRSFLAGSRFLQSRFPPLCRHLNPVRRFRNLARTRGL
jgi:LysR family transcriptional regulator, hydrogen peroxide-inducible genes activator